MCLLQKKHFVRPLKMLYRYKSKWYMPPKIKIAFSLSKAKGMLKGLKKIKKTQRNKLLKEMPEGKKKHDEIHHLIKKAMIPSLLKEKHTYPARKKYNKYKILKRNFFLKKKKAIIKNYLTKVLSKNFNPNEKFKKIDSIKHSLNVLNLFYQKFKLIRKIDAIKKQVLYKNKQANILKKRINHTYGFSKKYYLYYSSFQKKILATISLLSKKKKMKRGYLMLNLLKAKQSLILFKLKEKENYVYNEAILDSNFIEPELRENW